MAMKCKQFLNQFKAVLIPFKLLQPLNKFNFMKTRRVNSLGKQSRPSSTPQKDHQSNNLNQKMYKPQKKIKLNPTSAKRKPLGKYESIPFLPEIKLTIEDMKSDPLKLLMNLQSKYSHYGGVKLITPLEWNPPFSLSYTKKAITSRIQRLNQLGFGKSFEEKKDAYTLQSFYEMSNDFERKYKFKFQMEDSPRLSCLQNQYWNLVRGPQESQLSKNPKKYNVVVEYAADLPVNKYGSGFPLYNSSKSSDNFFNYGQNWFNLNNVYRSPSSLLKISDLQSEHIGGITIPWVYVGMQFSTFCWHVQDCGINSINYNHKGGCKVWYFIPEDDKEKFQNFVKRKSGMKNLLAKITYMLDPMELRENGIKVFKSYQRPGEYICTFFKAYHCGFADGFNVGEAINFVVGQSLPLIKQNVIQANKKGSPFCYEWLLVQNKERGLVQTIKQLYSEMMSKQKLNISRAIKRVTVKQLKVINKKVKYDRYCCCKCRKYLYLAILCCQNCKNYYCSEDVDKYCCEEFEATFELLIRQGKQDRLNWINQVKNKLS